jgi:cyclopropane-fatty-acyl-phospholipid synthase
MLTACLSFLSDSLASSLYHPFLGRLAPDFLLRFLIRCQLRHRLLSLCAPPPEEQHRRKREVLRSMSAGPLAAATDAANEQHYQVPTEFFRAHLGPRLKYSSGLWSDETTTFAQSEVSGARGPGRGGSGQSRGLFGGGGSTPNTPTLRPARCPF